MAGRFLNAGTIGFLCGAALFASLNYVNLGAPCEDCSAIYGWPSPVWVTNSILDPPSRLYWWNVPLDVVVGLIFSSGVGAVFGWAAGVERRANADVTLVVAISRARGIGCLFGVLLIAGLNITQYISMVLECRACYTKYGLPIPIWAEEGSVHSNFWVSTFLVLLIWAAFCIGMGAVFDRLAWQMKRSPVDTG